MGLPLADVVVRVRSGYDGAALRQANQDLNSYIARAGQASSLLAARFRNVALVGGAAISAVGKVYADVERSGVNLLRVTNLQGSAFERLSQQVRSLAPTLGLTEKQAIDLATTASRLGLSAKDIPQFITTVARASNALGLDIDTTADSLARLRATLNLSVNDLAKMTSAIVALDNVSAASFPEILDAQKRSAGLGQLLGVSGQDIAALSATLIERGVTAQRAGTGLQRIFSSLINRRADISNAVGFDVGSLPPTEAVLRVSQTFAHLVQTGGDTRGFLKAFGGDGQRVIEVLSKLGSSTDRARELMAVANKEFANGSTLTRLFAAVSNTLAFRFEQVKSSVFAAARAIGQTLAPFLHTILNAVERVAKAIAASPLLQYASAFILIGTVIAATAGFLVFFAASQVIAFRVAKQGLPLIAGMWRDVGKAIKEATTISAGSRFVSGLDALGAESMTIRFLENFRRPRFGTGLYYSRMFKPISDAENLHLFQLAFAAKPNRGLGALAFLQSGISGGIRTLIGFLPTIARFALPITLVAAAIKAIADNAFGSRDALVAMVKPLTDAFSDKGEAGRGLRSFVRLLSELFGLIAKIAGLLIRVFAEVLKPVFEVLAAIARAVGVVVEAVGGLFGVSGAAYGVSAGSLPTVPGTSAPKLASVDATGAKLGGTTVNIINPTVRSEDDLRRMKELVAQAVRQESRRVAGQAVST